MAGPLNAQREDVGMQVLALRLRMVIASRSHVCQSDWEGGGLVIVLSWISLIIGEATHPYIYIFISHLSFLFCEYPFMCYFFICFFYIYI